MRRDHSKAPDFWPGYVDALTNVVLNLLFVVAIFCLALFISSLKQEKSERLPGQTMSEMSDISDMSEMSADDRLQAMAPPVSAPLAFSAPASQQLRFGPDRPTLATDLSATPVIMSRPSLQPETKMPGIDAAWQSEGPALHLHVSAEPAAPVPVASLEEVADPGGQLRVRIGFPRGSVLLDSDTRATVGRIALQLRHAGTLVVWGPTDLSRMSARQATYLRLMRVRDALREAGYPSDNIDVRMTGGGRWPDGPSANIWLISRRTASDEQARSLPPLQAGPPSLTTEPNTTPATSHGG